MRVECPEGWGIISGGCPTLGEIWADLPDRCPELDGYSHWNLFACVMNVLRTFSGPSLVLPRLDGFDNRLEAFSDLGPSFVLLGLRLNPIAGDFLNFRQGHLIPVTRARPDRKGEKRFSGTCPEKYVISRILLVICRNFYGIPR